jgi:hypothetical protein
MESLLWEDEKEFDDQMRKEVLESLAMVEEALDHLDDLLESGEATHKFVFKQLKSELTEAETLVPPNHLVICRINNMLVRSANEMVRSQKKRPMNPPSIIMAQREFDFMLSVYKLDRSNRQVSTNAHVRPCVLRWPCITLKQIQTSLTAQL